MARKAARLLGWKRLQECGRATLGGDPQIWQHEGCATYHGLVTCGLLWVCPVCGTKITERRSEELNAAVESWRAAGRQTVMCARTVRHSKYDDLAELLGRLRKANRWYSNHRRVKACRARLSATQATGGGLVRSLEVTHAHPEIAEHNGWHPHDHELWFCARPELSKEEVCEIERELGELWIRACERVGLPAPDMTHGLKLEIGGTADYVTKWGVAAELTKGHIKRGKNGSVSPWDLLELADDNGDASAREAARLFREFATAFKGRHQLQWSRGLRDTLELGESKTDEELAAESLEEEAEFVANIPLADWRIVRARHLQADLLEVAERGGAQAVELFLHRLRCREGPGP